PSHSALSLTARRPLGRASSELQVPVGSSLASLGEPVIQLLLSKKVFEEIIGYNSFHLCNQ
ncbi:hypothetical protein, partial [Adlercreutzia equolifaciens]|uniref:hypothetical protein n=1 Tax=Adlercreutzia equolifaciens TaxID=446660 RepID=UPI00242C9620